MCEEKNKFTKLRQDLVLRINEIRPVLQKHSRARKLAPRPRKGKVYVVDLLRSIPIEPSTAKLILIRRKATKASTRKPRSLGGLIAACGGIRSTSAAIRLTLQSYNDRVKMNSKFRYVYEIFHAISEIGFYSYQKKKMRSEPELPFCTLCWRRPESSSYYCQIHHPKDSPAKYYADRRAIDKAVMNKGGKSASYLGEIKNTPELRGKYPYVIYGLLFDFAPNLSGAVLEKEEISLTIGAGNVDKTGEWISFANAVIQWVSTSCPYTNRGILLSDPLKSSTWIEWALEIIRALDSTEAAFWEMQGLEDWLTPINGSGGAKTILTLIQRHEAYKRIMTEYGNPKRGPDPGYNKNQVLRQQIFSLSKEHTQSEIGRILGISRQRVHTLMKEIKS